MPERRLTGIPPIRIERRRLTNAFVETYAKWHLKAEVQGLENILEIKRLACQTPPARSGPKAAQLPQFSAAGKHAELPNVSCLPKKSGKIVNY